MTFYLLDRYRKLSEHDNPGPGHIMPVKPETLSVVRELTDCVHCTLSFSRSPGCMTELFRRIETMAFGSNTDISSGKIETGLRVLHSW